MLFKSDCVIPGGHHWEKWKVIDKGNVVDTLSGAIKGKYLFQERKCLLCGKTELDSQEALI